MNRRQQTRSALQKAKRQIAAGQRLPFYLLYGEEDYEREATRRWLVEALAPETARDFNLDSFDAERLAPEDFLQIYQAYPMMAPHRLVVLKDCHKLTAEQCKALESIVERPAETTTLVAVGEKVDMRRRLFQQWSKQGAAWRFVVPFDNELPAWIRARVEERQTTIEDRAVDLLRLYIGTNLRELASELDKLTAYVGPGQPLTAAAVENSVGGARHTSVFNFTDALGAGNYPKASTLLMRLLDGGEEPLRLLAMASRHYQIVLKAQDVVGAPREKAAAALGVSPFFVNAYLDQARRLSRQGLWDRMAALLEAEARLKSLGRRQQRLVLDLLVHRLCGRS